MSCLRRLLTIAALAVFAAGCSSTAMTATDFTLTSDSGRPWRLSDQQGRPVLLTFGFAHCSDTCPATLARLAQLTRQLGPDGRRIEIAMVTVDPRRDTPAALHAFVTRFGQNVVGLTGSSAQIRRVESAYHVWAAPLGKKHDGGYDVAHTATIELIDARGHVRGIVNDDDGDAALSRALADVRG
jgi:protein SCO1/2